MSKQPLAILGGNPVRTTPMPARKAFGTSEIDALNKVIAHYQHSESDPPYGGDFEQAYCNSFSEYMGGGYSVAVATGTASVFVALAALMLPQGQEVILSPVTDSGPLASIIHQGYVPVIADAAEDSYNSTWEQIEPLITDKTGAIILVHCAGIPTDVETIVTQAHQRGIKVIEDCSQAPGARWNGQKVGGFGDIMATSTMYRKNIAAPGSGGIVYTKNQSLYHMALAHADRGKPVWQEGYAERDPSLNLFPALNWNTNELSCAVAHASLSRLDETITARNAVQNALIEWINTQSTCCYVARFSGSASPFFLQVFIREETLSVDKLTFCQALQAEGVDLNPDYKFLISDWKWALPYIKPPLSTPNTVSARDRSFNLYLNEQYTQQEVTDICAAIVKVEQHYAK
ncbi:MULTISPECIES: DegT/DnrJ/EryC1/StrS aminotransferase family protein [unclassified Pseudoalteromonas]|uniref:DegT/DnrJ/EryC1/StrS family aminotransferase n=1 Tax=Pseudoalteromonas TaxID=53246 RepID=UPI001F428425|nr:MULTISPECIES: DegT/DnrJ/EryC1/StrS family aminotransferase [unclassified Pseudoalteromonas]MCF2827731.1 DegT/DnrJ/EryC1/StrS family aminotransferase [Pseudoalteromonas sp. OF5H-5]MCF2830271.1 DegT/DnrJ/EryC1/StrS family aminotransferase [Pseudoalteromonas sp. DL2-H6]MCF2925291.1 DegT/DnrJ/EryC1/StrS family aminotransferase [Pseudoalteromonas sp. DL2-H1]